MRIFVALQSGGMVEKKQIVNESELIKKAQAGDEKDFAELMNNYQARVMKIISRYVNDYTEIQDLTQETFIKAYSGLDKFRGESKFYTWIYRVAINTAKNYIIKQSHSVPTVDVELEPQLLLGMRSFLKEISTPEQELLSEELQADIFKALDSMSEELKITLMLFEVEGLSYDDIADVLDCPVGTIRSRIFRARDILKEKLNI